VISRGGDYHIYLFSFPVDIPQETKSQLKMGELRQGEFGTVIATFPWNEERTGLFILSPRGEFGWNRSRYFKKIT